MKNSFHGKPVINLQFVIWDDKQPPLLVPGMYNKGKFIAPNMFLLKIENDIFMFYWEKFRLHGTKLFK